MNEIASPVSPQPAGNSNKNKIAIFVGIGCLVLCCLLVVLGVGGYFVYQYFMGSDPISAATPQDALVCVSFDLAKLQSDDVTRIASIFQEIGDPNEDKTPMELLDETLKENMDITFAEGVLPWLGTRGGLIVTKAKVGSSGPENAEFAFILSVRDQKKADEFVQKLIASVEKDTSDKFDKRTVDGSTIYVQERQSGDPTVVARIGSLLYIANSQEAVTASASVKQGKSLADLAMYKKVIKSFPANRVATFYVSESGFELLSGASTSLTGPSTSAMLDSTSKPKGLGASLMVDASGLRLDYALGYDQAELSDFDRESFKAKFGALKTVGMSPEGTFLFVGTNTSLGMARGLDEKNPYYNKDVKESLDLLEKQYGVDLRELVKLLGSEFSIAVAPDKSKFAGQDMYIGVTVMGEVKDEQAFVKWFEDALNSLSKQSGAEFTSESISVGSYDLKKATAKMGDELSFFYGASKGFLFISTSQQMLTNGLDSPKTLKDNPVFKKSMAAFPSGSMPYFYINIGGALDAYQEMIPSGDQQLDKMRTGLNKLTVLAASINQPNDYVLSGTMILFVESGK